MYRPSELKTGLLHQIGWRQNYDVSDFKISDSLTVSNGGQYFQDFHPLLTLENLKATAPTFNRVVLPAWGVNVQYRKYDRVKLANQNYRAKLDNKGKSPDSNLSEWELYDAFSEWLENKTGASILNMVQTFFSEKIQEGTAKNLIENKALFDSSGRLTDLVPNTHSLVGLEIIPIRAKGITMKIEKIGLQFKGVGKVKIYIMHSSSIEPVIIHEYERTADGRMQWFTLTDIYLPYISSDTDAGGSWYLCYDQDEIGDSQAIFKMMDWSGKPCPSCNRESFFNWQSWSKYLEFHPFKIKSEREGLNGEGMYDAEPNLWDISKTVHTYDCNYGINLQITLSCDLTDFILEQKNTFENVLGLQVACDLIREMALNPSFKITRLGMNISKNDLLYEVDGLTGSNNFGTIGYKLKSAMKALKIDTEGMNRVCLPCNNGGIRYRST